MEVVEAVAREAAAEARAAGIQQLGPLLRSNGAELSYRLLRRILDDTTTAAVLPKGGGQHNEQVAGGEQRATAGSITVKR